MSDRAFPSVNHVSGVHHEGMTIRDWFAGQALAGLIASGACRNLNGKCDCFESSALLAYSFANEMIREMESGNRDEAGD